MKLDSVRHGTFTLERVYPAPPARVFRAWSDPAAKAAWFRGGDEWELIEHPLDFREGGRERVAGGKRGGPVHLCDATYHDIVPNRRIVYSYVMSVGELRLSVSLVTVEFHADGTGTRLVFTESGAFFVDDFDGAVGRERGTRELLDKLGAHLDAEGAAEVTNTRVYPLPPDVVFAAWSDPTRLSRWWGPRGFRSELHACAFRPGGDWTFTFHGPDGATYENHWVFQAIDSNRHVTMRHLGDHHAFTIDASFDPEGEGTRLTWVMRFDDAEQCARVRDFVQGANEQNFDRLGMELRGERVE